MWECCAAEKVFVKSLMEVAATALKKGQKLDRGVAVQRRIGSASREWQSAPARPNGTKSDDGRKSGRLVRSCSRVTSIRGRG